MAAIFFSLSVLRVNAAISIAHTQTALKQTGNT